MIELNYDIRNQNPKLFLDRDPLSAESQKVFLATDMLPLPQLTPEKYRIIFYRLRDMNESQVRSPKIDFFSKIRWELNF